MGSGKGGKAPKAPDPWETAQAEASVNRVNTYSPSGSGVRYGYTDASGQFVAPGINQPAAPAAPATPAAPASNGQSGKSGGMSMPGADGQYGAADGTGASTGAGMMFRPTQTAAPATGQGQAAMMYVESPTEKAIRESLEPASVDFTKKFVQDNVYGMPGQAKVQDRGTVAQDIFNRNFSLMSPGIDKANERLITNLQARGIPIGSEAWQDSYGEQLAQTQDTISRLSQDANVAAGQEQSRQFALDSSARQNAMSEIMAVMGGNYQPPAALPQSNAPTVNYSGLVSNKYNADMNAYQQKQQQQMSTMSTIGQIGAAMIKSNSGFKEIEGELDVAWAGEVVASMPVYAWHYRAEHAPGGDVADHVGPMAEHFHAMTGLGNAEQINVIDYFGLLTAALRDALLRVEMLERHIYQAEVH